MKDTQIALTLWCFASVAFAANWTFSGAFSGFFAYYVASGKDLIEKAATTCIEYSNGVQGATGNIVIDRIENGPGGAKENETPPSLVKRLASENDHQAILDRFNTDLRHISMRATHIVPSHVHPDDGIAVRFNVFSDGSTLHAHTNGTHVMTMFDADPDLEERDNLPTDGHYYHFNGVGGLKVEARIINHPTGNPQYHKDLSNFAKGWAYTNLAKHAIIEESNNWRFSVCNKAKTAVFFYGKFSATVNPPEGKYTQIGTTPCK